MEENQNHERWTKRLLFSFVFSNENRLHAVIDRHLDGITCRQWLLLVVRDSFPEAPTLSQLASILGCSRQNIKKLALSLEKDGYIVVMPSPLDKRSISMTITEKGNEIIQKSKGMEDKVHYALFREFSGDEISEYYKLSLKFKKGIENLEESFSTMKEKGEI